MSKVEIKYGDCLKKHELAINSLILDFEVHGTFCDWKSISNKDYSELITITLEKITSGKYYHISKVNFCPKKRILEIHVEKVSYNQQQNKFEYKSAVNDGFDLTESNPEVINKVRLVIYNRSTEDNFYTICEKLTEECLKYPHDPKKCDDKTLAYEGEHQPETHKGNILVGKK